MDRAEATKILAVLKAAYPHSFNNLTRRDAETMIDLWAKMFEHESYADVNAAVGALVSTRVTGFSPTIGEVKERLETLRNADDLSEQAAWALVSKACQNGLYGFQQEFEKLPEKVQRAVGAPEQLKAWASMDADTVESVVASNFMRNYKAQVTRERENAKLPPSIRNLISGITERMKMLGNEQT